MGPAPGHAQFGNGRAAAWTWLAVAPKDIGKFHVATSVPLCIHIGVIAGAPLINAQAQHRQQLLVQSLYLPGRYLPYQRGWVDFSAPQGFIGINVAHAS